MNGVEPARYARALRAGQSAELHVLDIETGVTEVLFTSSAVLFEAPNWHPGRHRLVVNGDGVLFWVELDGNAQLEEIQASGLPEVNNDHLIAPDGESFFISANDGHIYQLPIDGGRATRITTDKAPERIFRHFLHGVSPDGKSLAYVGTEDLNGDEWGQRAVWILNLESGDEQLVGDGYSPADGPDFAPDGNSIFFNSEARSSVVGHAQIFQHDLSAGQVRQLTHDERVNWFPHPSPNGLKLVYLSYPAGTVGHPADLHVELRLIDLAVGGSPRTIATLFGGQGTINMPSWSPDSRRLAYVTYPIDHE